MKQSKLILNLATLVLVTSGCAKEFKTGDSPAAETTAGVVNPTFPVQAPPGQGAGSAGDNWSYGATVDFKIDSLDVMNAYVATHPLNNPTNIKLNVNVYDVGGGHFGGQVKLAYDDAGRHYEGYFVAGTGVNKDYDSYNTAKDTGLYEAQYNTWFNNNTYFSGYFQDSVGAVVLSIDELGPNLGDGQGSTTVNGSIWYKNFATAFPTQGMMRFCWFIYRGAYQCGTSTVSTLAKSTPYPSDGYQRLGTFTGLSRSKAFNQ
ncbi:MAG: hypothetical protein IPM97_01765 [Bdellovibrionaceae bacterium]|nr:hypothetical protein [Pseudobdellovibrionaceae bacterium]